MAKLRVSKLHVCESVLRIAPAICLLLIIIPTKTMGQQGWHALGPGIPAIQTVDVAVNYTDSEGKRIVGAALMASCLPDGLVLQAKFGGLPRPLDNDSVVNYDVDFSFNSSTGAKKMKSSVFSAKHSPFFFEVRGEGARHLAEEIGNAGASTITITAKASVLSAEAHFSNAGFFDVFVRALAPCLLK